MPDLSPITSADVGGTHSAPLWVGIVDGVPWWIQPVDEGTRYALVRERDGEIIRLSGATANLRTRVHEYGGQPWVALPGGGFVYTEWADQRLYSQTPDAQPMPLTPAPSRPAGLRYAAPMVVGDEVWALREEHYGDAPTDVRRDFVAVPLDGSAAADPSRVRALGATGHHFLAGLRLSPDGSRAAWIGWNHPYMSWDRSEVVVADVIAGGFANQRVIAGGAPTAEAAGDGIAVCQLEWQDDDTLLYLSDLTGWFNLYRHPIDGSATNLLPIDHELGGPLWRVGQRWFAQLGVDRFVVLDHSHPAILDAAAATLTPIDTGALSTWGAFIAADGDLIADVAAGPKHVSVLATLRLTDDGIRLSTLGGVPALPQLATGEQLSEEWLPTPEFRWFEGEGGVRVPAYVYRPIGPGSDAPGPAPYVVHIHGGPTGENGSTLDLEFAYLTSRGIGIVVPEYGGSTGYGRLWRERLNGQWGVVDLHDASTVATALVAEGLAAPGKLGIRGGSAGGFTTAAALTTPSPFGAGVARYPVIDLVAFASGETHDLESQYMASIVGRLPEDAALFEERSPQARAGQLHSPILILQGLDDQICMASTTERFVDAIADSPVRHEYIAYEGEQHGFRKASTVRDAIEREYAFFAREFGLTASEPAQ